MNLPIVSSASPITLIGGADPAPNVVTVALKRAPSIVCADGGADTALWSELQPLAVIGDMDSISAAARDAFADVLHPIAEQNSTDFDKALRNIQAPLVLAVGFLGARLDHTLASLHVALRRAATPVILLGDEDIVFIAPERITLILPVGQRFSLLPLLDTRVTTKGLKWEVRDGAMSMRDFIGSSNEVAAQQVTIEASTPGLAVIIPLEALDAAVAGLTAAVRAK